jgi:predicted ATPase
MGYNAEWAAHPAGSVSFVRDDPMIKKVRIRNFKSLVDVSVDLEPVTVLIGRSGTGKTNFIEALRWLRDYLTFRNDSFVQQRHGGWFRIVSATGPKPAVLSYSVTFTAPGYSDDFAYELEFRQTQHQFPPVFAEEQLRLGERVIFHQESGKWVRAPDLVTPPQPGQILLGALTGIQEATIAGLALTSGIGCYAFPDDVLTRQTQPVQPGESGFADDGGNFLRSVTDIAINLQLWQRLPRMVASLRRLKPTLKSVDLDQPQKRQVILAHERGDQVLVFDLAQESEGFRRLFACLLALNQTPHKLTLLFDEPEKGIYPVGLAILADEFKGYADKGHSQVILTTHSPEFLDHFRPEQIRVVEMHDFATKIGPVAADQMEALREHFLEPRDLLTVTDARLETPTEAVTP